MQLIQYWMAGLMAGVIVAAGLLAAVLELRLWGESIFDGGVLRLGLLIYALPILVLGFVGMSGVGLYNGPRWGAAMAPFWQCHDQVCRVAVANAANAVMNSVPYQLVAVEIVCLVAMLVVWKFRTRARQTLPAVRGSQERVVVPNPKKWHYDAATGEYHRVTGRHKGFVFFSGKTYGDRVADDYERVKVLRGGLILVAFGCALWTWCHFRNVDYFAIHHEDDAMAVLGEAIAWMAMLPGALGVLMTVFHRGVGPAPTRVPGREEVERQKVHGAGRFATPDEVDQAGRGRGGFVDLDQKEFD